MCKRAAERGEGQAVEAHAPEATGTPGRDRCVSFSSRIEVLGAGEEWVKLDLTLRSESPAYLQGRSTW